MKKKHNGWKAAFIILAVLVVLFFVWLFFGDDEYYYDDYYDDYYGDYYGDYDDDDDYGYGHSSQSGSSGAVNSVDNTGSDSSLEDGDVLRDRLVTLKGNDEDTVTVLVYMNGSDLESDDGAATEDLSEMVAAGSSDSVHVIVETLGTRQWKSKYGISSQTAQIYELSGSGLKLVKDNLGSVDCGKASGLTDFIRWGVKNYPADRYILLFWDHGGGPVYGFGYDDKTDSEDSLTIAEMKKAIRESGAIFDFIGMDCCIMSSIEVCCALYDYCDYMILSEDFESGAGWSYTGWLKALYTHPSLPTPELGKVIVDDMVSDCSREGEDAILSVIDQRYMKLLYTSWVDFAYANENTLLGENYSRRKSRKAGYRVSPILESHGFFSPVSGDGSPDRGVFDFFYSDDDADMSEYYITDLMSVAGNIKGDEASALASSLNRALVYMKACGGSAGLTGFSVTLPYGDTEFYDELKTVFLDCGFDKDYVSWLAAFAESRNSDSYYDYDGWDDYWSGWDDYEDDYDWDDWDEWGSWDDGDWGWTGGHHH